MSSQLDLAVSSYRHSRRSRFDLEATYLAMDDAVAARTQGEEFVTCLLGRLTVRQLSHTVLDHHGGLSDDTTAFSGRLSLDNGGEPDPARQTRLGRWRVTAAAGFR